MKYGVITGRLSPKPKNRDWSFKPKNHGTAKTALFQEVYQYDKRIAPKTEYAPELVQAAKHLGLHPLDLMKLLNRERDIQKLAQKFSHS